MATQGSTPFAPPHDPHAAAAAVASSVHQHPLHPRPSAAGLAAAPAPDAVAFAGDGQLHTMASLAFSQASPLVAVAVQWNAQVAAALQAGLHLGMGAAHGNSGRQQHAPPAAWGDTCSVQGDAQGEGVTHCGGEAGPAHTRRKPNTGAGVQPERSTVAEAHPVQGKDSYPGSQLLTSCSGSAGRGDAAMQASVDGAGAQGGRQQGASPASGIASAQLAAPNSQHAGGAGHVVAEGAGAGPGPAPGEPADSVQGGQGPGPAMPAHATILGNDPFTEGDEEGSAEGACVRLAEGQLAASGMAADSRGGEGGMRHRLQQQKQQSAASRPPHAPAPMPASGGGPSTRPGHGHEEGAVDLR